VASLEESLAEAWGTELETLQWYLGQLQGQPPFPGRKATSQAKPIASSDDAVRVLEVLDRAFAAAESRRLERGDSEASEYVDTGDLLEELKRSVAAAKKLKAADAPPQASEESPVIGSDIPWAKVSGVWMRAVSLTPFAAIEAGKVRGPSFIPYGLLSVDIWTDPNASTPSLRALLPIRHREDYKAVSWTLSTNRTPNGAIWVMYSPAKHLSSVRPVLGVVVDDGVQSRIVKKANDPFRPPRAG
jgi:hypothetical protein